MRRRSNVVPFPYLTDGQRAITAYTHTGSSALAWIEITIGRQKITSSDPDLLATSRLLVEQRSSA